MSDEKTAITVPDLPNVVSGDGRYVMTQIRKYLKEMAVQINLANGFSADSVYESTSGLAAPSNFILKFDSAGGHFSWSDVSYFSTLAYYELRTDANVGLASGLIDRTTENTSDKMPSSASGKVYLFAVCQDKSYSSATVLSYSKPRPLAPDNIAITKNEQGTLVTYTYIPLDCIGAHIYIDGIKYETDDNVFLYTGSGTISEVDVAYYDSFGDGVRGYLYCTIPDVTNFIVEKNGSVLNFQWDPISLHGISFVVKTATTPSWEAGTELFRTALCKNKIEYPNAGDIYFLIKAYDEHGNYSTDATWYLLTTIADKAKNVIKDFDQYPTGYPGNKLNMYYDPEVGGLRLSDNCFTGEYIFKAELAAKFRARNWYDANITGITDSSLRVQDMDFSLNDSQAALTTCMGGIVGDIDSTVLKAQIARYLGGDTDCLFLAELSESLLDSKGNSPTESQEATVYDYGRWDKGLLVNEMTRLKYAVTSTSTKFNFTFSLKVTSAMQRCVIAMLTSVSGWLELGYDNGFYLLGSDGKKAFVNIQPETLDCITFGISQDTAVRALYVKTLNALPVSGSYSFEDSIASGTVDAAPLGVMNTVQFYKGAAA
jgi:hypothetical protein